MSCRTRVFTLLTCSSFALSACEGSSNENSPDTGSQPQLDAGAIADASPSSNDAGASNDAGNADASGPKDAGAQDATVDCTFVMPSDCVIPDNSALPSELRCTGLYAKFDERVLACHVLPYTPAFELWSDGAKKQRFVFIPAGKKVDTTDPLDPVYPVGTKFWKEFRTPDGQKLLETRLLEKSADGWIYTSYVWTADAKNAIQMNDGVPDVLGTGHAVPTRDQCDECHRGRKDKILGWDAFLLGPGAQGITNADLVTLGFVDPGKEFPALAIPGNDVERAALGYVHANCGVSCHNRNMRAKAQDTGLMMRLEKDMLSAASATPVVRTGLYKVPGTNAKYGGITTPDGGTPRDYFRAFVPHDPQRSLSLVRMMTRGADGEMPSIASKKVDDAGVAIVRAWIEQMTPEAGYIMPPDAGI